MDRSGTIECPFCESQANRNHNYCGGCGASITDHGETVAFGQSRASGFLSKSSTEYLADYQAGEASDTDLPAEQIESEVREMLIHFGALFWVVGPFSLRSVLDVTPEDLTEGDPSGEVLLAGLGIAGLAACVDTTVPQDARDDVIEMAEEMVLDRDSTEE